MTRLGLHAADTSDGRTRAGDGEDRPPARPRRDAAPVRMREALASNLDALYRFILVRVGFDDACAEDLLQQTAAAALAVEDVGGIESVEAWLRGVARNLVRRHWRDSARRNGDSAAADRVGRAVLERLEGACPREVLESREMERGLLAAIARLGAEEQRLLYAFYRHGRPTREIAEELGCSEKGVEMRLYRVRARLRESLASGGDD